MRFLHLGWETTDPFSILSAAYTLPLSAKHYFALAGGTIPFIRRYSTIWP